MADDSHTREDTFLQAPADAHARGSAGDDGCGATVAVWLKFGEAGLKSGEGGSQFGEAGSQPGSRPGTQAGRAQLIEAAGARGSGSAAAVEAARLMETTLPGKSWRQAAAIGEGWLAGRLAGKHKEQAARYAIEALHRAFEDALRRGTFPGASSAAAGSVKDTVADTEAETVLVAMSGGVDSSVACLLEQRAGRRPIGVTMRLWSDPECPGGGENACCSPESVRDARSVCHLLGVPHLTVDYKDTFRSIVVEDFITGYTAGRTPNPCTCCNRRFRFPQLLALARRLGADSVATGHYARIVEIPGAADTTGSGSRLAIARAAGTAGSGNRLAIARAADAAKDQSYMLWGLEAGDLAHVRFPLSELTKAETRALAREAALPVHARPESQEVCFIPDNNYRRFLRAQLAARGRPLPEAGEIVDSAGEVLGRHGGFLDYTIGQRRGLGLSSREPLYVTRIDATQNRVIVGQHKTLEVKHIKISDINVFIDAANVTSPYAQVRYNSAAVSARITAANEDSWLVELEEPVYGVAAGQSAVIYEGDTVAAGGVIQQT